MSRYPSISRFMKFIYSIYNQFSNLPKHTAKTYTFLAISPHLDKTTGKDLNQKNRLVDSSAYSIKKILICDFS